MIGPNLAVVTLVAPAHLADLGGVEDVAREKALLPARLLAHHHPIKMLYSGLVRNTFYFRIMRLDESRLPYISLLTDPTTGGVTASFAMLAGTVSVGLAISCW